MTTHVSLLIEAGSKQITLAQNIIYRSYYAYPEENAELLKIDYVNAKNLFEVI